MIDMISLAIPFKDEYVIKTASGELLDQNLIQSSFNLSYAGQIDFENGQPVVSRLRHNFESLPSSFASLAFKLINGSDFKTFPYIKVVGNPAKLLQGHNVYGSDDLNLCIMAVVEAFMYGDHNLHNYLDLMHATIDYIDVTYTAHAETQSQAQAIIDIMRQVKCGQTKPQPDEKYLTTMYWNRDSKHRKLKAYLKLPELCNQILELTRKHAKTKYSHFAYQLEQVNRPEVREFAQTAIRFEARLFANWFQSRGLPATFAYAVDPALQQNEPDLLPRLWRSAFKDVFASFEGATMNAYNTNEVEEALKIAFHKVLPSGNISYAKANRIFQGYLSILHVGYNAIKAKTDRATWKRLIDDLNFIGLSKAQLMNLNGDNSNVVPLIRCLNIDFSRQLPEGFTAPKSLSQQFKQNPALLRLVS
jgi:II/X family phage/plasmid replication protein